MGALEEITEAPRSDIDSDSSQEEERDSTHQSSIKRKRSKQSQNSNGSHSPAQSPPSVDQVFEEKGKEDVSGKQSVQKQSDSAEGEIPTHDNHRVHFYAGYHNVAKEYDSEFLKKHGGDLDTTLIFAGLFSAVASAFIIEVDSQLQRDPSDETAALLRVLIYKIDNTTFGNDVPTLPQWAGPPRAMVQVQAILFASLTSSLFAAFLAMLGKQWLNRYRSPDMRGSVVQRSQSRQQKLAGVVAWYFDHVMDSLPLMLQAALLLLGCALSRYLWEIDVIVSSVILGVTSFGVLCYLFIVIVGTASESCPYQTPAAHIFRRILHYLRDHLLPALRSAPTVISAAVSSNLSRIYRASWCYRAWNLWWTAMKRPWYCMNNFTYTIGTLFWLPIVPVRDIYVLGQATLKFPVPFCKTVYYQLMGGNRTASRWFMEISSLRTLSLGQKTIVMDLQCISWILRASLDKDDQRLALEHLISRSKLTHIHPTLLVDCLNIFTRCFSVSNGKVAVIQDLELLATTSADAFLSTLHHLTTVDPSSSVLADVQRQYVQAFPSDLDFTSLEFHPTMTKIHALAGRFGKPRDIQWENYSMSIQEHISYTQYMVQAAQEEYQKTQHRKVPRWILCSALYFLSLGSVSPPSVVANCLTIIAIDLDCNVPDTVISDESGRVESVSNLIIQRLGAMVEANDSNLIISKRKAINTLFPHAIFLEQSGKQEMIDAILRTARASDSDPSNFGKFMWHHVTLYTSRLFESRSPTSLNRVIALISPFVSWDDILHNPIAVSRWAAAALAIPYTDQVGQNVIDALFQITNIDLLRPHVPIELWRWLKKRPVMPPVYSGLNRAGFAQTTAHVRRLSDGDIDILKSYFLLVWAGQDSYRFGNFHEMERAVREDFCGAGMEHHREDLVQQLDHVLGQLEGKGESQNVKDAKAQYTALKDILLEGQKQ